MADENELRDVPKMIVHGAPQARGPVRRRAPSPAAASAERPPSPPHALAGCGGHCGRRGNRSAPDRDRDREGAPGARLDGAAGPSTLHYWDKLLPSPRSPPYPFSRGYCHVLRRRWGCAGGALDRGADGARGGWGRVGGWLGGTVRQRVGLGSIRHRTGNEKHICSSCLGLVTWHGISN